METKNGRMFNAIRGEAKNGSSFNTIGRDAISFRPAIWTLLITLLLSSVAGDKGMRKDRHSKKKRRKKSGLAYADAIYMI